MAEGYNTKTDRLGRKWVYRLRNDMLDLDTPSAEWRISHFVSFVERGSYVDLTDEYRAELILAGKWPADE